jgi:hypothetical protein
MCWAGFGGTGGFCKHARLCSGAKPLALYAKKAPGQNDLKDTSVPYLLMFKKNETHFQWFAKLA